MKQLIEEFMVQVVLPIIECSDLTAEQFEAGIGEFLKKHRYYDFYYYCIVPENMPEVFQQLCEADSEDLAADYIDMWEPLENWTVGDLLDAVNVAEI